MNSTALQRFNTAIASGTEYLQTYFERLGKYAEILDEDGELKEEVRDIPVDSTASIEQLRDALNSKFEVRQYLNQILGEDIMEFLDEDTKRDLSDAYLKHTSNPRDSISASGRAFEDFLRNLGDVHGNEDRDYGSASGIILSATIFKGMIW